jgi:UDP-GlcNAc:undecaprenyl-phosphate/decaprenyl-phosphate GlcNAc-1-phosphate transferase
MHLIGTFGEVLPFLVSALLAAAVVSLVLTPLVRRASLRLGTIDQPNHRRVNEAPVPRGGGIAVAVAFLLVSLVVIAVNAQLHAVPMPSSLDPSELLALLLGGAVAAMLGALDDALQLRARWQLGGQLLLGLIAIGAGISVSFLNNPFGPGYIVLDGPFAAGFTLLWVIGMINSINFIDGLDGLSSGIALIAVATLGLISVTTAVAQPFVGILCFALAGALLGFLRWNFHPASIFIGTSGVMFVGYTLALLAILGSAKVAVALLVLGVPIIDTFWIIVRRLATGRSPFTPDRGHIHHRLLDLGLGHGQTVVVIYAICIGLAVLSFVLSGAGQVYAFLGLAVAFGLALFFLTRGETGDALEAETYEQPPAEATVEPGRTRRWRVATASVSRRRWRRRSPR